MSATSHDGEACQHCCSCVQELREMMIEIRDHVGLNNCPNCGMRSKNCQCVRCPRCRRETVEWVERVSLECLCGGYQYTCRNSRECEPDCSWCQVCESKFYQDRMYKDDK